MTQTERPRPAPLFTVGATVLYRPRRPDFLSHRPGGQPAIFARYSRSKRGGCFIELASGGILRVPESDIEPLSHPPQA